MVAKGYAMNLNQLINDYSEIISLFLDYSGNTIVILADYEYRVLCCSTSLAELMHIPDKPIGRFLGGSPMSPGRIRFSPDLY